MNFQNFVRLCVTLPFLAILITPVFVFAQTATVGLQVSATASTSVSWSAAVAAVAAKARADKEITRRIAALNDLNTRIQAMTRVSSSFKQTLASNVKNQIQLLTALQVKIDADSNLATLKTDIQSITQSYRIFILVLPQGRISAMADRVANITFMMQGLGVKLQARLQAAAAAGNSATADSAILTDLGAKLTDAQTQAQATLILIGPLTPDNGNQTAMAANTKALQQARSDLGVAQQDLVQARKDIALLLKAVLSMKVSTPTSVSASTTPATH